MSEPASMPFCVRLGPGAPPERIGGKARSLLRLSAAGLSVPRAIVVTTDLFAARRADLRRGRGARAGGGALARRFRVGAGARDRHAGAGAGRALRGPIVGVDR